MNDSFNAASRAHGAAEPRICRSETSVPEAGHVEPTESEYGNSRFSDRFDPILRMVRRIMCLRTRNEDARRRSFSPALMTTPNTFAIASYLAFEYRTQKELKPLIEQVSGLTTDLEFARRQRKIHEAAERRIERERSHSDQRKITSLTYAFIDFLYTKFGIDGSALAALTGEDYVGIAKIVLDRHASVVPELYKGARN